MTASQTDIAVLEKKVGANASSALFAHLADLYLLSDRAKDALKVCDRGLAHYPFYSTGHLVKGKALLRLKMNAEARREFELVLSFLPGNKAVQDLLDKISPLEEESLAPIHAPEPAPEPERDQGFAPLVEEKPAEPEPQPTPAPAEPVHDAFSGLMGFDPTAIAAAPPAETETLPEPSAFTGLAPREEAATDAFGFGGTTEQATTEGFPPAEVSAPEEPSAAPADFGFPPAQELEAPAFGQPQEQFPAEDAGGGFAGPEELPQTQGAPEETYERFVTRMNAELPGRDSLTLEEYLESAPTAGPAEETDARVSASAESDASTNTFDDIAERLQTAKRITPVINLADKTVSPVSEQDRPASSGFVTPTLAEIYAKQGWYEDAIKAYHTLMVNKPAEKEKYEQRVAELEELKRQQINPPR